MCDTDIYFCLFLKFSLLFSFSVLFFIPIKIHTKLKAFKLSFVEYLKINKFQLQNITIHKMVQCNHPFLTVTCQVDEQTINQLQTLILNQESRVGEYSSHKYLSDEGGFESDIWEQLSKVLVVGKEWCQISLRGRLSTQDKTRTCVSITVTVVIFLIISLSGGSAFSKTVTIWNPFGYVSKTLIFATAPCRAAAHTGSFKPSHGLYASPSDQ